MNRSQILVLAAGLLMAAALVAAMGLALTRARTPAIRAEGPG